jgi:hypothetical protein
VQLQNATRASRLQKSELETNYAGPPPDVVGDGGDQRLKSVFGRSRSSSLIQALR